MGQSQSSQNPTEQKSLDEARQEDAWKNVELNVLITGDSGAGKSSFINAVRG